MTFGMLNSITFSCEATVLSQYATGALEIELGPCENQLSKDSCCAAFASQRHREFRSAAAGF
jgi:hypothetical protein